MSLIEDFKLAQDLNTPEDKLTELAKSPALAVKRAIAMNPASPKLALQRVFHEFSEEVLNNSATAFFNLEAESPLAWMQEDHRQGVAERCVVSPSVLAMLASDRAENVRLQVAANLNTNAETVFLLSRDSSRFVRLAVAKRNDVAAEILEALSTDAESPVRLAVAQNPNASLQTLVRLTKDKDGRVKDMAKLSLHLRKKS